MDISITARLRAWVFSWAGIILVLGLLIAGNTLSQLIYKRFDFSTGRSYSIASGTKAVLGKVKDILVIKVYFTPHLPPPYGLHGQYLKDLLGEYKSAGRGRIKLEFLNPEGNEARKKEAREAGVLPVQINVMARDKFEVKEAFMGAVFLYNGKTEIMPVLEGTKNLEYDITRRIKKLTSPEIKTVGFVTGHGEKIPSDQYLAPLFRSIEEQVNTATASLDKPLPSEIAALWVLGPVQSFKPAELEILKNWVQKGLPLGLLINRRNINFQSFYASPINTGLEPLLKEWGLELRDGFVIDAQSEKIQMETQYGQFMAMRVQEYPYIPIATNFNASHPASRGLEAVTLPFVHPIAFKETGGFKYTSLVDSSRLSWFQETQTVAPGQPIEKLESKEKGPFSLAGVIEGRGGRVILVGTAYTLDPHFSNKAAQLAWFMNLLDWSIQDESLLSIRTKGLSYRPLRRLSDAQRFASKYVMISALPLALLLAGFLIYRWQKALKKLLPQLYADA